MKKCIFALLMLALLCACGGDLAQRGEIGNSLERSAAPSAIASAEMGSSAPPVPEELNHPTYVESLAASVAGEIGLPGLSGEAAVRAAYRWLVETVYFADPVQLDLWRYLTDAEEPISYLDNRAFGPLYFQIGSCEDFAAAMVLLLRQAGFPAEYVAGYTLSVDQVYIDHAWAVVFLEGQWYHLDPQLEQNVIRSGNLTWRFYLKSDREMNRDHKWGEGLIDYFGGEVTGEEQRRIREEFTPPPCPGSWRAPEPVTVPSPKRPDGVEIQYRASRVKAASGKGELPPIPLNVEPPILVAARHITPPLLDE